MCQFAGKTMEDELNAMWLSCAIESEGSIQLAWGRRKDGYIQLVPRINLANQAIEYIQKASNILSAHINTSKKTIYATWYGMKRVKRVLETILPHMCIKRKIEIAKTVLEFVNYRLSVNPHVKYGSYEQGLFEKIRELNGKGRLDSQELKVKFSKESSETIRQTPKGDDIVRSA